MLALGADSAAALAKSRTIEALVLKRSILKHQLVKYSITTTVQEQLIFHTITGHSRLAGDTSWDQDDLRVSESILEARRSRVVASDGAVGVDVAQISSDTRATADIVEGELGHSGVELHQQGERLANASRST